jgi:hypothetical protein
VSHSRSTRLGKNEETLDLDAEGSHFRRRFGRQWKLWELVEVERQQQDMRWMTNSASWLQNRGGTGPRAVKQRLAVQSYGWKGGRFWRQKLSFSASFSQVPIF